MKILDVAATCGVLFLGLGFLVPLRAHSQDVKDTKLACASNLKQIAMAAIQYGDDKRFFPHLSKVTKLDNEGDSTPKGNDVPPRCLRALVYFGYVDSPKVFACPGSDDAARELTKEAKKDLHAFGWLGSVNGDANASPIAKPMKEDKDADALTDLSYGWTLKGLTVNARSTFRLAADRGARLGPRSKQKIAGNHSKGWNVVHIDAHVDFVKKGSDEASGLSTTDDKKNGFLVVWDEKNAGDAVEEKGDKKSEKKSGDKKDDEDK